MNRTAIIGYEIIEIPWTICQNALVSYDFHSSCTYFHKNNSIFVISIKNWIYKHVISILLMKSNFSKKNAGGYPRQKIPKNFWTWISRFIYHSTQFLAEIANLILFLLENEIYGIFMPRWARILRVLLFLLHFSTKIISNFQSPPKTASNDI